MPIHFSPLLIAALLLSNFVIAQHIGLRPAKDLHEVIGLGACTVLTLIIGATIDWPLMHLVLQPLGLAFLHNFCATLIIAVSAHVIELALRHRYAKYFPRYGNFLPLIIIDCLIVAQPLLNSALDTGFIVYVVHAAVFGAGAAGLLVVFQMLREHTATAELPAPLRGAAIDMLSAGLIIAALSGLAGMF